MLKPIIGAMAVAALVGSSLVYAQQRFGDHGMGRDNGFRAEHRHHLSADDINAFADARIAALKAGLELTPDQAKNWPAFEAALRSMVQMRIQRVQARQAAEQQSQQDQHPGNMFDRLARRADNMSKRSAALKQIADAGAPLYQSLDDAQKQRFRVLAVLLHPHHHHFGGGWREGAGYGRDGGGPGSFGQGGWTWRHRHFGEQQGGDRQQTLTGNGGDQDSQL